MAEIRLKRHPAGWAMHATWANAAGERRALVRYDLGDAELAGEVVAAVELMGLTTSTPGLVTGRAYCGACAQVEGDPHAAWCEWRER